MLNVYEVFHPGSRKTSSCPFRTGVSISSSPRIAGMALTALTLQALAGGTDPNPPAQSLPETQGYRNTKCIL